MVYTFWSLRALVDNHSYPITQHVMVTKIRFIIYVRLLFSHNLHISNSNRAFEILKSNHSSTRFQKHHLSKMKVNIFGKSLHKIGWKLFWQVQNLE